MYTTQFLRLTKHHISLTSLNYLGIDYSSGFQKWIKIELINKINSDKN